MMREKVLVAMSGGVDSSVTAALLKDRGYEIIGVTMRIWPKGEIDEGDRFGGCCGLDTIEDARKVANILGIPHYSLNFRDVFREKVIANFYKEYKDGKTPNPCIRCNQYIKFDALLKKAQELGINCIATGHYAKIEYGARRKRWLLKKGIDHRKDQSYVLYVMTQDQLERTLMPLGVFTKDTVREIAREKNLPVADKPESQEICFVPDNDYGGFLEEYAHEKTKTGAILNKDGKVVGKHQGIIFYTVGQRKKIGITSRVPLYVIAIDSKDNSIVVGEKEEVYSDELIANDMNLIATRELKEVVKVDAKIRYRHQASPATIIPLNGDKVQLKFDRPQWAITPGQAVVFYNGDIVVGGGTIAKTKTLHS